MADIASRSRYATIGLVYYLHHIARSVLHQIGEEHRIASPATFRRHLHHMDHLLDLRCHPLQYVCNPFEVEGEGELISEVVVEMVGEVMVEMVREIMVHLSRHCLLRYPPILTHHPRFLYPHRLTHPLPFPQTRTHVYHIRCCQSQPP